MPYHPQFNRTPDSIVKHCTGDPQEGAGRMPQVMEQIQNLEKEITDNHDIIQRLRERLVPVLNQTAYPGPPCDGNKAAPEEILVPLADRLRSLFSMERENNIILRQVLSEIEL